MIEATEQVLADAPSQGRRRSATATGTRAPKSTGGTARKSLSIPRVFSDPQINPYDQLEWERRTAEITDDGGKVVFKQESVEVPKGWSLLATKVVVSKYFYGEQGTSERETSVRQLVHRICRTIADWGVKDGYFSKADGEVFYDELTWLCLNQYGAFNSPVWFNVGLYHQYHVGNCSSRGNWFTDPKTGRAERAKTQYEYPQCSACFIQSVQDNMESIMQLAQSEAMLFKFGSGTGTDLSPLRSSKEKLSGGGRPSGPLSFLRVYDQVANVVKSGGKTRRAAKMNTLHDWHGDIEEFIEAKMKEERKAWALIEQGYDGSYNGDAYGSVMYQNENLSVRVSNQFMEAAQQGKEWWTRAVTTGRPLEKKDASTLLHKIAEGTWVCGDPGLQYDGAIQKWHTCKGTEPIHSTNPCSEYVFLNNTACNLASLNLMKFKREDSTFDVEQFKAAVRVFITAQEILVDNASYPTKEIAENSHIFRTLGLGYANLGSLIMSYGLPYDSNEGRALAGAITAIMTGHAYEQSAELASVMGAFKGYRDARCAHVTTPLADDNVESMLSVIKQHREAVEEIQPSEEFNYLKEEARLAWDRALERGRAVGYRNAQVTVLAPTGTIAFLMDCDTTGIEPDIALVKYKLLAGGGLLKIVNRTVPEALHRLGYSAQECERIIAHIEKYDTIEDVEDGGQTVPSGLKPEHLPVFDCAFKPYRGQRSIQYLAHLKMMGAAQPFISGAISKTVNMPNDSTVEDIRDAYVQAWKMGLKCVAIYRDGSKRSQPLNTKRTNEGGDKAAAVDTSALEARIKELEAEVAKLARPGGQTVAPPPLRHAHGDHAQVRHRGPRRLSDRRIVREQPAGRAVHHDGEGRLDHRRADGRHRHLDQHGAAIRRAAGSPGQEIRPRALRAVGLHQEPRHPQRGFDHRLCVPLDGDAIHSRLPGGQLAESQPAGAGHARVAGRGEEEDQPARAGVGHRGRHRHSGSEVRPTAAMARAITRQARPAERTVKTLSDSVAHFQQDAPTCPNCGHVTVRNGACYKCLNCGESLGCS